MSQGKQWSERSHERHRLQSPNYQSSSLENNGAYERRNYDFYLRCFGYLREQSKKCISFAVQFGPLALQNRNRLNSEKHFWKRRLLAIPRRNSYRLHFFCSAGVFGKLLTISDLLGFLKRKCIFLDCLALQSGNKVGHRRGSGQVCASFQPRGKMKLINNDICIGSLLYNWRSIAVYCKEKYQVMITDDLKF